MRGRRNEALKESEERFRVLFESTADGILVADIQTRKFKFANPAICRMLGYSEEELKRMGVDDIHPKDKLEHVISEFKAQARGEKTLSPNIPCLRKDGTIVYADINTTKALFDGRECNIGFFREITERKRMEEALRESEKRYRTLVETMNEGLDIIDENGVTIYTNDKLCEILGYSRDELIGHPVTDFLDKNGRKIFEEQWARLRKGERRSYEIERTRRDGQEIFLTVSSSPIFDADGHFNGTFAVVTDITERKRADEALRESEKRYRTLVETMNEGLHVLDENGVTIFVNDKLCEMLGYSRDEMIGRPLTDFLDKSAQNIFEEQWAMRRKGERGSYELVRTRKDGQKIFTLVSAAPIFDADGNFKGSFAVITDLAAILQITVSLMERMAT